MAREYETAAGHAQPRYSQLVGRLSQLDWLQLLAIFGKWPPKPGYEMKWPFVTDLNGDGQPAVAVAEEASQQSGRLNIKSLDGTNGT